MPYEVLLANRGDVEQGQDPNRRLPGTPLPAWFATKSLRAASEHCKGYIAYFKIGEHNWTGGAVRRVEDGSIVAQIGFSGRAWHPEPDMDAIPLDTDLDSLAGLPPVR